MKPCRSLLQFPLSAVSLAVAASACGPAAGQMTLTQPDAAPMMMQAVTPDCTLAPVDAAGVALDRVVVSEGGRASLHFGGAKPPVSVAIASAEPEGLRFVSLTAPDLGFEIRPAYGSAGVHSISVSGICGTGTTALGITVEVQKLRWTATATWTAPADGPAGREYGAMWIDPINPDRLFVFGGFLYEPQQFTPTWDLWERDLSTDRWHAITMANDPPQLQFARVTPMPGASSALLFGGLREVNGQQYDPYVLQRLDTTAGQMRWAPMGSANALDQGEIEPAWIYDAPGQRYIAAGGMDATDGLHIKVRAYHPDQDSWELLPLADGPTPTPRRDFFYAYDEATRRLLLFAGDTHNDASWACQCANDTWALELGETPARWVLLDDGATQKIGRRNGASAIDPIGHRWLVWGGTADGATTFPGLWALDLDRGNEKWVEVEAEGDAPIRSSGMGVYDSARKRILMGFGNNPSPFTDLWALAL